MSNTKFIAVKLTGYNKSFLDITGGITLTGGSGGIKKGSENVNDWLVFVDEGGKVTSLEQWELQKAVDHLAEVTGEPVSVIIKNLHSEDND